MNKQLKNLSWIFLAGFAGSVIVLWACKFSAIECLECHDHSLSLRALEFRNNAFVGFQHKEVEDVLGSPLQCEECESVTKEDFFWWPSFLREDTPYAKIKQGQKVRFLCFSDNNLLVYVCEVLDSNDVWRVIGDVTPPENVTF